MIGYARMTQATVGLQAGGQAYSQLILFENKAALDRFTKSEWAMSAQATAVAAASGAGATAKYKEGVMVFVTGQEGLMAEASIGGQKFKFEPER
jgi:lipid-binding SYLF domain-containing protein